MSFNKSAFVDTAKVSMWVKESKAGKRYLSGTITFNDGTKVNISLFHNDNKKQENSPEFWGKLSCTEDRLGDTIILKAEEEDNGGYQNKRPASNDNVLF
jgi:hypothetical protein